MGLDELSRDCGPGTMFEAGKTVTLYSTIDGTMYTIMVIATDVLVPWAKPGDYPFDPAKPLPKIVPPGGKEAFPALFGDGAVRMIPKNIDHKTLKALFT